MAHLSNSIRSVFKFLLLGIGIFFSYGVNAQCSGVPSPEICLVSIDSTNNPVVVWENPNDPVIDSFFIYREDATGSLTKIGETASDSLSLFEDTSPNVDPDSGSYSYALAYYDTCANITSISSVHQTVHLTATLNQDICVDLNWTPYVGFNYSEVYIWRDGNGNGSYTLIDTVSAGIYNYSDWTMCYPFPSGEPSYFIEVPAPDTCSATRSKDFNSTRSNHRNVSAPASIEEIEKNDVKVFPNPSATGSFAIESGVPVHDAEIEVFDIHGRSVAREQIGTFRRTSFEIQEDGVYQVRVEGEKISFNKVLIVQ